MEEDKFVTLEMFEKYHEQLMNYIGIHDGLMLNKETICPKCGNYMIFNMRYNAGCPIVEYKCSCGYSTSNGSYTTDNKTHMNKDINNVISNHT